MLFSSGGRAMRFHESAVRKMGRTAAGVRGIRMPEEDTVIGLIVVGEGTILSATKHGYGKRSEPDAYPTKGRGGMGVLDIKTTDRNGPVIGAVQVRDEDEIMMITDAGTLVRTAVSGVSTVGRNTQGVRLIRLSEGEALVEITRIDESDVNTDEDSDESDVLDEEGNPVVQPIDADSSLESEEASTDESLSDDSVSDDEQAEDASDDASDSSDDDDDNK